MTQRLNLIIYWGPRQAQYPLQYILQQNEAKLKIQQILNAVNKFISNHNIVVKNYLNIWVVTKNGKQNIFKIKRNHSYVNLVLNENSVFELKIILEDIQDKQNLLKFFHSNSDQYMRLSNNINRIIEQSKQQQKKRGEKSMRPIDIAYFFADPLVTVSKNKIITKHQVSYQLQYDKFIELVKKEQFGNNFRIEMMVATKTNIKKTLIDGASILHFSCHGKKRSGNLQIQSETSVGQLVDLQHKQFINLLDIKNTLPKLIIFNVCYSSSLAELISNSKKIITIGYNDQALDTYCQQFTRQFYMELFKYNYSVRELFYIIKDKIVKANPVEGNKLCIFPVVPFPNEQELGFFANTQTKLNFIKKWTLSQSMRQNDSLGVKSQMFTFIKQYLTLNQRISYFFLKGQPYSGKSDFMKKTKIYVMNRKVFTQDFTVDLRDKDKRRIQSMLQLRLQKEDVILKKMAQLKDLSKQRRTNPIIVIDHTQKLLMLQYGKFIEFIQNKIIKQLKYGKVVILTNNIKPIIKQEAQLFEKANSHSKHQPHIESTQVQNYIKRYASQQLKVIAQDMYKKGRCQSHLALIKALKKSRSERQMQQYCQVQQIHLNKQNSSMDFGDFEDNIGQFQRVLQSMHECATIKIQDNDYIFLSTIFSEIKLQSQQHYTNKSCSSIQTLRQVKEITQNFAAFIKLIFKKVKKQHEFLQQIQQRIPNLIHLSLKIAAILYIFKEFTCFEQHLLSCQKFYVLISGFYSQELHRKDKLYNQVSQYHLKILLTLYSFYTQNQSKIKYAQLSHRKTNEQKQYENSSRRKAEIIIQQIQKQFSKSELQNVNTIQPLCVINGMVQELHYNKVYNLFAQNQHSQRRLSQVFDLSNDEPFDSQQQTVLIDQQHQTIIKYWKAFQDIDKYSKSKVFLLNKKSMNLIQILVIKKISFNLRQLQVIFERGQSFLNQNTSLFVNYYIKIMEKIQKDNIFDNFDENGLFCHNSSQAMKPLYQQYLKAYISAYFNLSKIKQNLTKQYRLPIYYQLINLCEQSHTISGITSIKKMIELHINKQFFSTWTCPTFVSLPLVYEKGGSNMKYNIKRFQNHVYNFIKHFYENQIDKQVKFQFKIMGEQLLSEQQQQKRHLIQLIICDCVYQSQKIYLQDTTSKSKAYPIRSLYLPKAPVTIYFGKSVKVIEQMYKQNNSIVIWINIDKKDRDIEDILQKQKSLNSIEQYNNKLGIYYNVLEYFYCSFCRHFFNGGHSLFIEQVKNSYDLAKAQTLIKTKILYSSSKQFYNQKQIQMAIDQLDSNFQYLADSRYGKQLKKIPAYHFIYKQKKPQKQIDNKWRLRTWELGCNHQIHQLLLQLNKIRQGRQKSAYFMIYYKSQIMLSFFINTLRIKLIKMNKFALHPEVTHKNYVEYRKKIQNNANQQSQQNQLPTIIPFVNLLEYQIIEEFNLNNSMVKLFFTQKKYVDINLEHKRISLMSIKQSYKTNKVQYQFYYLYCKTLRPKATQKKLLHHFKEVINQASSSLLEIKTSIQRL